MKKLKSGIIEANVLCYLLQYCSTPHLTIGASPAEMLMGHYPRSHLDLMLPDMSSKIV